MTAALPFDRVGHDPWKVCCYGDCTRRPDYLVESYEFDFRGCVATIEPDPECPTICAGHRDDHAAQRDKLTIRFTTEPHLLVRGVRFLPLIKRLQQIFLRNNW